MSITKKILLGLFLTPLLLIAGAITAIPAPAFAQTPPAGLTMSASAAYNGYFKYGEWLPIWVTLENVGRDINAELRVSVASGTVGTNFNAPAELPSGSRKRIPLYVLPNNFSRQVEVQLVENGMVIATSLVDVNPQMNINFLVGIISESRGTLPLIASIEIPGQPRPVSILDIDLDDIPDRAEGLRSLSVLILNNTDTSTLSAAQSAALEGWVRQGGRLVIGGGTGALKTTAGLPQAVLPVALEGDVFLEEVSGLAALAGGEQVRTPGPFLAALGAPVDRSLSLASAANPNSAQPIPLVQELSLGSGKVDFIALDLTASPFDAWGGVTAFWQSLLSPGASYPDYMPPDMSARQQKSNSIYYALSNLPMLDLPSVRDIALLLGVYILLVGPVNYLVLRWRKMLNIAWLTVPLITLVFAAGAFGLGAMRRGSDIVLNEISVTLLQTEEYASVTNFVGLFSPGQQSFSLEVDTPGLLSPLNPYYDPWSSFMGQPTTNAMTLVQSQPALLRGLSVSQGAMQGFLVEGNQATLGLLQADLFISDRSVVGSVDNQTSLDLKDVVLVVNSQFQFLGDLPAGESLEVNLVLQDITQQPFYMPPFSYRIYESALSGGGGSVMDSRRADVRRSILESVFDSGSFRMDQPAAAQSGSTGSMPNVQAFVIGWLDGEGSGLAVPKLPVKVTGEQPSHQLTGLVYQYVPVSFQAEGRFSVPPGLLLGQLVESSGNFSRCGDLWSNAYYIGKGEALLRFDLPASQDIDSLLLGLVSERGWLNALDVALYDWQQDSWVTVDNLQHGVNQVSAAQRFIDAAGQVRLQVSGSDDFGNCVSVSIGMEGTR